jgi:hypothetical protein
MAFDLALADLVRPYVLRGEATPWHAALSVIYVESFETALGPSGATIRGVARFSGAVDMPSFDPATGTLRAGASNTEGHPRTQPDRTEPWLDITDTRVEFALTVPRVGGAIIAAGMAGAPGGDAALEGVRAVLDALDAPPLDTPISDYPNTGFRLDLVLAGIEMNLPFLQPAELRADGLLVPHRSARTVTFRLPKIKLRAEQGSDSGAALRLDLVSMGVGGLDDPGDMSAAEVITMEPPHAFIGTGRVVGFGFRSAWLDLSDGYTPPEVLDQFGFDESWTGLYLPEVRLFFAPEGAEDFAVSAGVENLLIGLGASNGLTGDFDVAVINQGSGELAVSARFFTPDGRAIGITRTGEGTATAAIPATTRIVVDAQGGRAPYAITVDQGAGVVAGQIHEVALGAGGERTVSISVTDTSVPPKTAELMIRAGLRRPAVPIAADPGGAGGRPLAAKLETTAIMLEGAAQGSPRLRLISDDREGGSVIVGLDHPATPATTAWTLDGGAAPAGTSITVPLAGGETKTVSATLPGETWTSLTAYFRFDTPPKPSEEDPVAYSLAAGNVRDREAIYPSRASGWSAGATDFSVAHARVLSRITGPVTVTGTASFDGRATDADAAYNFSLSQRRAAGVVARLAARGVTGTPQPAGAAPSPAWITDWRDNADPRAQYWSAQITGFTANLPGTVITGTIERPVAPPAPNVAPVPETPPAQPEPPDWFRSARLKLRIVRDQFVALEMSGEIDFQTAVESAITSTGASEVPDIRGVGANPADGITDFLFLYQTDPASHTDEVKLYIGADPADRDGLVMTGQLPGQALLDQDLGRNLLGMTTIFTPLLAGLSPDNPSNGSLVAVRVTAGVVATATALAELDFFNVERVILFGGEGAFRRIGERWEMSVLFDVETAVSVDLSFGGGSSGGGFTLLRVPRDRPLAVRYKAIGLSFGQPPGGGGEFQFRPVFDQSKGYTIDVSGPGAIEVAGPLGQILQVLGARIARTNPLNFEIDLGLAVDLGVVTIERARVRMPLDPVGPPELTGFGAGLNVPGVLEGSGYLLMRPVEGGTEIKGGIDVRLVPVKLRIAGQLAISPISASDGRPAATGVAVSLEIELPVAIPLANSGFGIYGFLGMFAMHYERNEDGISSRTPALTWLKERAGGNPTNLDAWKPALGKWAFGAGITLGTMGTSFVFNVKGMFLLELPGPRILLVVKANLLAKIPALKNPDAEGTLMCVIDLDFGRGTLTIGVSADFEIAPLVEIKIPVEAFFDFNDPSFWHVYLGSFIGADLQGNPLPGPVRISVLGAFDGAGYAMISGHGIPPYDPPGDVPSLPQIDGFGIAVGLETSLIWGNLPARLYLKVTAGFNAVLGVDPLYVSGTLYIRGELMLFVVSVSASAQLSAEVGEVEAQDGTRSQVSRISGEVCGEIDLFFFEVRGCVDFRIGEADKIPPPAPDLFVAGTLVSRSPALVEGTATGQSVDGKLADMAREGEALPEVPINAIPVLTFAMPPKADGLVVMGREANGPSGFPGSGYVRIGTVDYCYELFEVTLERVGGGPITMQGETPSTWWTTQDVGGTNQRVNLSLLNWVPFPTPKALERTRHLDELVKQRWGTLCHDPAPAAPVLWTFHGQRLGPSSQRWQLTGTAFPDPPETQRSSRPDLALHVREAWRTGDRQLDQARGIIAAAIEGALVPCAPRERIAPPLGPAPLSLRETAIARSGIAVERFTARDRISDIGALNAINRERLAAATRGSFGTREAPDVLTAETLSLAEVRRRIVEGEALRRGTLLNSLAENAGREAPAGSRTTMALADGEQCPGRVLAAPIYDVGLPVALGNRSREDEIARQLDEAGYRFGPLSNAIVIESGAIVAGNLLLWANARLLHSGRGQGRGLMIHFLGEAGDVLGERPMRDADAIAAVGFPSRWTDAAAPWFEELWHAVMYGQTRLSTQQMLRVELDPPKGTHALRIGVLYGSPDEGMKWDTMGRPFHLAAIELTRLGEATRFDWDSIQIKRERKVVEDFLGPVSGDLALLYPNSEYRITAKAHVKLREKAGPDKQLPDQEVTYRFRTDDAAPERLDPWLLAAVPAAAEQHVFAREEIKVVFGTNDIDRLYGAYGLELRARLKAASFRHPEGASDSHPFPIAGGALTPLGPILLSPFEAALSDLVTGTKPIIAPEEEPDREPLGCIPVCENRSRHALLRIPIPLERFTDYLLDIEAVPVGADADAVGQRVYRHAFSTGAFDSLEEFAQDFLATRIEHRGIGAGVLQATAAEPRFAAGEAMGPELDEALIAAGLEPMPVPKASRIVVFWEQAAPGAPPQPAALLVDASEPMLRRRPLPAKVAITDPDGIVVERGRMVPETWLWLAEVAGGALVDRILYAPGHQRALISLRPGGRGHSLRIDLVRRGFPDLHLDPPGNTEARHAAISLGLVRAPWEED